MVSDSSTYETFSTAEALEGREFHIVGELATDSRIHFDPKVDANYFSFYMIDKGGEERKVVFRGTKPQDFERSEQIVLTGKMEGSEFLASKILMKCPSKYVPNEEQIIREAKIST